MPARRESKAPAASGTADGAALLRAFRHGKDPTRLGEAGTNTIADLVAACRRSNEPDALRESNKLWRRAIKAAARRKKREAMTAEPDHVCTALADELVKATAKLDAGPLPRSAGGRRSSFGSSTGRRSSFGSSTGSAASPDEAPDDADAGSPAAFALAGFRGLQCVTGADAGADAGESESCELFFKNAKQLPKGRSPGGPVRFVADLERTPRAGVPKAGDASATNGRPASLSPTTSQRPSSPSSEHGEFVDCASEEVLDCEGRRHSLGPGDLLLEMERLRQQLASKDVELAREKSVTSALRLKSYAACRRGSHSEARTLQALWRGHVSRSRRAQLRKHATRCAALRRGASARRFSRRLAALRRRVAAARIQALARRAAARRLQSLARGDATRRLQDFARRLLATRGERSKLAKLKCRSLAAEIVRLRAVAETDAVHYRTVSPCSAVKAAKASAREATAAELRRLAAELACDVASLSGSARLRPLMDVISAACVHFPETAEAGLRHVRGLTDGGDTAVLQRLLGCSADAVALRVLDLHVAAPEAAPENAGHALAVFERLAAFEPQWTCSPRAIEVLAALVVSPGETKDVAAKALSHFRDRDGFAADLQRVLKGAALADGDEAALIAAGLPAALFERRATEAPAVEEPAVEAPAVEAPPAVDAPAVDAPAVEEPPAEEPTVEAPAVDAPAVDAPAVVKAPEAAPSTAAPAADVADDAASSRRPRSPSTPAAGDAAGDNGYLPLPPYDESPSEGGHKSPRKNRTRRRGHTPPHGTAPDGTPSPDIDGDTPPRRRTPSKRGLTPPRRRSPPDSTVAPPPEPSAEVPARRSAPREPSAEAAPRRRSPREPGTETTTRRRSRERVTGAHRHAPMPSLADSKPADARADSKPADAPRPPRSPPQKFAWGRPV
ncbi:hypothetical protein M885DRAFT_588324 [Pelagophyceae sp. CCMP2097]|nr:hypothetical protein M885DRAFT_588324 [Pelagophyceae sp. CCMP2097]